MIQISAAGDSFGLLHPSPCLETEASAQPTAAQAHLPVAPLHFLRAVPKKALAGRRIGDRADKHRRPRGRHETVSGQHPAEGRCHHARVMLTQGPRPPLRPRECPGTGSSARRSAPHAPRAGERSSRGGTRLVGRGPAVAAATSGNMGHRPPGVVSLPIGRSCFRGTREVRNFQ